MPPITWADFERVDIRAGTVVKVEDFPEAKRPAYKLWIDFGRHGVKKASAQLTALYRKEELLGKQVVCVTNFPRSKSPTFDRRCSSPASSWRTGSWSSPSPSEQCLTA